jgi:hypothetical protein
MRGATRTPPRRRSPLVPAMPPRRRSPLTLAMPPREAQLP